MVRRIPRWAMLLVGASLLAVPAHADGYDQEATKAWHGADQCAKDAFTKYPDYTPASNAKREATRRECLRNHKLPAPTGSMPGSGS